MRSSMPSAIPRKSFVMHESDTRRLVSFRARTLEEVTNLFNSDNLVAYNGIYLAKFYPVLVSYTLANDWENGLLVAAEWRDAATSTHERLSVCMLNVCESDLYLSAAYSFLAAHYNQLATSGGGGDSGVSGHSGSANRIALPDSPAQPPGVCGGVGTTPDYRLKLTRLARGEESVVVQLAAPLGCAIEGRRKEGGGVCCGHAGISAGGAAWR